MKEINVKIISAKAQYRYMVKETVVVYVSGLV